MAEEPKRKTADDYVRESAARIEQSENMIAQHRKWLKDAKAELLAQGIDLDDDLPWWKRWWARLR